MLEQLYLNNFPSGTIIPPHLSKQAFVMKTCQRTLVLNLSKAEFTWEESSICEDSLKGEKAYIYLLEIICGLKSRLLGENEIVSQFKSSYKDYIAQADRSCNLLLILEKLLQDAKKIRTQYLLGLSQKTYSSIARKAICSYNPKSVLILGSGQLAEDLINQFKKKTTVFISARNDERTKKLMKLHGINQIPWKDFTQYSEFPFIVNSIGGNGQKLISEDFFNSWSQFNANDKLFIDLGSPSIIQTSLPFSEGVMRLEDIFNQGAIHEQHKMTQVDKAKQAMVELSKQRNYVLQRKLAKIY
jgi:glutamyl-tRNA reductase